MVPNLSLIIPTKNRAMVIENAIRSILHQSYCDYELIIVDNDDNLDTQKVCMKYTDERLVYVRTGGLDMVENWNVGINLAKGRFITIVEDKMAFYAGALDIIAIELLSTEVLVWSSDLLFESNNGHKIQRKKHSIPTRIKSNIVLDKLRKQEQGCWQYLPRGLNAAFSSDLVKKIKNDEGGVFFDYISPDLTCALKLLTRVDEITVLNKSLNVIVRPDLSNGKDVRSGKADLSYYYGKKTSKFIQYHNVVALDDLFISTAIVSDVRKCLGNNKFDMYSITDNSYQHMLINEVATNIHQFGIFRYRVKVLLDAFRIDGNIIINLILFLKKFTIISIRGLAKSLLMMFYNKGENVVHISKIDNIWNINA